MRYYKIRILKKHFEGAAWDQVKKIVRGLIDESQEKQIEAEKLLAQFCYQEQSLIVRFLRGRDI